MQCRSSRLEQKRPLVATWGPVQRTPHPVMTPQNSLIECLKIGLSRWVSTNCKSNPVLCQCNMEHGSHTAMNTTSLHFRRVNSPAPGAGKLHFLLCGAVATTIYLSLNLQPHSGAARLTCRNIIFLYKNLQILN